jgi:nucleotide-binding universal stress UspA family protein
VTAYLIPIKKLTAPALAAVRFALEFGKRNGGAFYFLFVEDPTSPVSQALAFDAAGPPKKLQSMPATPDPGRQAVETQLAQARIDSGLQVESVCRQGDFIQEVRQFVRDHHIAEIILGVPDESPDGRNQAHPDALLLHQLTRCRILTVKPKAKEQDPLWSPSP